MKKNKIKKTNAMRLLDKQKIDYIVREYAFSENHLDARSVLKKMKDETESSVYKTLVAVGDKTGIIVGVIPAENELDLKRFSKISGNKKIDMLPVDELEAVTGYLRGGCSPIGMKKNFPTYFSHHLLSEKRILVSGGKRGIQIDIAAKDLLAAANAEVAEITDEV